MAKLELCQLNALHGNAANSGRDLSFTYSYQLAVLSGAEGGLREMVDMGLSLMPSIMYRLFGLDVYNSDEICGHSDDTELWNSYWIKKVCIKKQTLLALEATREQLTGSAISMLVKQQEKLKGLLGDDEFFPAVNFDFETTAAAAFALERVSDVLRSAPVLAQPPATVPPCPSGERRVLTWRRSSAPKRARIAAEE